MRKTACLTSHKLLQVADLDHQSASGDRPGQLQHWLSIYAAYITGQPLSRLTFYFWTVFVVSKRARFTYCCLTLPGDINRTYSLTDCKSKMLVFHLYIALGHVTRWLHYGSIQQRLILLGQTKHFWFITETMHCLLIDLKL